MDVRGWSALFPSESPLDLVTISVISDQPRTDLGSISGPRIGTEADVHENG